MSKDLRIYNSLTRKVERFEPIKPGTVGMYTCGPTVYDYVSIGNWRTYVLSDIIHRVLIFNDNNVDLVMNITDVGHLTGDNIGDANTGEDRIEKASAREGKKAWDIAGFYANDFKKSFVDLNLLLPLSFPKATEHIDEQIQLIKRLEAKGFTYKIQDGIYFDTKAHGKAGYKYGELSSLDAIEGGARVTPNPEKKDPRDFALWKLSKRGEKRQMEWGSPWGDGFPGWHLECSAMSMKFLGEQFDIHVGGEDLRSTHHPNEIAQSEAASGKHPFVRYWIHGAFLLVDGGRMGKSLGNAYTIQDIKDKGVSPLALRYFFLGGHYRKQLNFTWEALEAGENALTRLYRYMKDLGSEEGGKPKEKYVKHFKEIINDDLNTPQALAYVWEILKDKKTSKKDMRATLLELDKVLGLGLKDQKPDNIPDDIQELARQREEARTNQNWEEADRLRLLIEEKGFEVKDTDDGPSISSK